MPEARTPLAEAVIHIANALKGNSAYMAIEEAMKDIVEEETMEVPDHLKDSNYSGAKKLGMDRIQISP